MHILKSVLSKHLKHCSNDWMSEYNFECGDSSETTSATSVFYVKYFCPCGIPVIRRDIVIDSMQRHLLYDLPYIMKKRREMWNEENHGTLIKLHGSNTELHWVVYENPLMLAVG